MNWNDFGLILIRGEILDTNVLERNGGSTPVPFLYFSVRKATEILVLMFSSPSLSLNLSGNVARFEEEMLFCSLRYVYVLREIYQQLSLIDHQKREVKRLQNTPLLVINKI